MDISIKDKVNGALFGYAIGDALGVGTEFMTVHEVKRRYPQGLTHYSQIIRDAHRSQWERGEVTNDTLFLCILIESISACNGFDPKDYARRLREWYLTDPIDVTQPMRWVLSNEKYADDPFGEAEKTWAGMKVDEAPSDALGRSLIIGMWGEDIRRNAEDSCRLTHVNSRCVASASIIAAMAHSLMWEEEPANFDDLLQIAEETDKSAIPYIETAYYGKLEDFKLDDEETYWYARKAMGCALWAVWHCDSTMEAIYKIINSGGDSDTNASLAAGLLGLKYGVSGLDKTLLDGLVQRNELQMVADDFLSALERKDKK